MTLVGKATFVADFRHGQFAGNHHIEGFIHLQQPNIIPKTGAEVSAELTGQVHWVNLKLGRQVPKGAINPIFHNQFL